MAWTDTVTKAAPSLLVSFVGGVFILIWQQSTQLAEMNKTLLMICDQMKEKTAIDSRQDAQIGDLRVGVERFRR
jgi:hypothetical protein